VLESDVQNFFHAVELGPPEVLHFFASTVYSVDAAINLIEPLVDLIKPVRRYNAEGRPNGALLIRIPIRTVIMVGARAKAIASSCESVVRPSSSITGFV
jgi:hypothetical protein